MKRKIGFTLFFVSFAVIIAIWAPTTVDDVFEKTLYPYEGKAAGEGAVYELTGEGLYDDQGLSLLSRDAFSVEYTNGLINLYSLGKRASSISDFRYSKVYTMVATAYTAGPESTGKRPGMRGYGITASGMRVQPGVVAVDPRVIPLGTHIYVQGYGYSIAADTGGAIKGKRIDVYKKTVSEAYKWGRRTVKVYVLK